MIEKVWIHYDNYPINGDYRIVVEDAASYLTLEKITVKKEHLEKALDKLKEKYPNHDLCFHKY